MYWIIFISLFLAPVGVILTIIFFLKSKRKRSIKYCLKYDSLIRDFIQKVDGLNIEYLGSKINTLSITKIAVWNDGTETIDKKDIPKNDNFSISINNNYEILDVSMIQAINESNDIKTNLSLDKKEINVDFEYLDRKEGFVLQIFHTGTNNDVFSFNGSIKGFGKIAKGKFIYKSILQQIIKEILPLFAGLIVFFISSLFSYNLNTIIIILLIILIWLSFAYIIEKILMPVPWKLKTFFKSFN